MVQRLFSAEYIRNSLRLLTDYLRNPILGIQRLPEWGWDELLFHVIAFTAVTGSIAGLVQSSVGNILYGLLIIPLVTFVLILVGGFFFYFFFQVFAGRTLSLRKIMTLIFFANIPFFIFQTVAVYFPPISLIGLAFTGFILITGFTSVFGLERRLVSRTILLVYAMFALVWLWSRLDAINFEKSMNQSLKAPPVQLGE